MTIHKPKSWFVLITQYLAGQGLINLLNILVGLILLRVLSMEEFALYIIATVLQQLASVGSDAGLSHAINTMGAKVREDRSQLGSLFAGARYYGYRFYAVSACLVVAAYAFMQSGHGWSSANVGGVLVLVLLTSLLQVTVNFRTAILNVNHDAAALFRAGMAQAVMRMLLLPLCLLWPFASIAVLGNLAGAYACKRVLERQCESALDDGQPASDEQKAALRGFVIPLLPVLLYHNLLGQLSIFLLGYYGYTAAIAEVGALGRLGQLLGLLMLLNSFFVMPVFSRIQQRSEFVKKSTQLMLALVVFSLVCMLSVYWLPDWWLYILGKNYSGLENELPVAVLTALLGLIGATLYVLVISRNTTQGQSWYIVLGLTAQVAFLAVHGVHSTYDALWLNLMPVLSYACVQAGLLARVLAQWKEGGESPRGT